MTGWIVVLGLAALAVIVTMRRRWTRMSPRELLDRRLARGQIDAAKYTRILAELTAHGDVDDRSRMPWH